jgi:RNA exonuclease 4
MPFSIQALLLTHPALQTRDTQMCPIIRKVYGSRRPGLRKIIKQEFGVDIQAGEHCSVRLCAFPSVGGHGVLS